MLASAAMSVSLPAEDLAAARPRPQPRPGRIVGHPLFWLGIVALGVAVPLGTRLLAPPAPPLPILGTLPPFALTDQDGRGFGSAELDDHVWLAGFIFTRCPTICPAITATMGRIQHRARGLEPAFHLVSFSVDPAWDTPARLSAYAARHKASPRMWSFVTGPLDAIKATVVDGLKIAIGAPEGEQDFASVFHGTHFVLVDQQRRIRGYYDSSSPEVVDRVLHDAAMLINRGR